MHKEYKDHQKVEEQTRKNWCKNKASKQYKKLLNPKVNKKQHKPMQKQEEKLYKRPEGRKRQKHQRDRQSAGS
jgi:hypothetical protein